MENFKMAPAVVKYRQEIDNSQPPLSSTEVNHLNDFPSISSTTLPPIHSSSYLKKKIPNFKKILKSWFQIIVE